MKRGVEGGDRERQRREEQEQRRWQTVEMKGSVCTVRWSKTRVAGMKASVEESQQGDD